MYSKGVLVQAKRVEKGELMSRTDHLDLVDQCDKMLAVSPSSFVFDYTASEMRCGSALRVRGSTSRELFDECSWTSYRFFLELFRCPVGDPKINSAKVRELDLTRALVITASDTYEEVLRKKRFKWP